MVGGTEFVSPIQNGIPMSERMALFDSAAKICSRTVAQNASDSPGHDLHSLHVNIENKRATQKLHAIASIISNPITTSAGEFAWPHKIATSTCFRKYAVPVALRDIFCTWICQK